MKSLLALAICLELFTTWVVSSYVAVPCTSPESIALAEEAIDQINAGRKQGFKYALDRVENSHKQTNGNTTYYLEVDIRETKCHVLSPKSLAECPIRPFKEIKGDGDCKIILDTSPGNPNHVSGYKCDVSPDSVDDVLKKCPDCPHLIPITSHQVEHAVTVSIDKFNKESTFTHRFDLHGIMRSSTKGVGFPVYVEFVIKETTCFKHSDACTLNILLNPIYGFCTSTVTPGIVGEIVDVKCELFGSKGEGSGREKAGLAIEGDATVPPEMEGEGTVFPTMEEGGTAPPAMEDEGTAPSALEEGGTAPSATEEGGTLPPTMELQTIVDEEIDVLSTLEAVPIIQQAESFEGIPPKRKRSALDDSSESSEELVYSPGKPFVFPDLPADLLSCPEKHRYHEYQ
ncbi:alpha-2-HS-glycoprotein-like [Rhinoraja longicauda]